MIDQSITWDSIYRAIRSEQNGREVYQGVVTDRNPDQSCVWVRELSSDPIEVTGHGVDLTYFEGGNRKTARVGPSIPEIGDLVLLARTASDQFKCVGVLQQSAKWAAQPAIGSAFSPTPAQSYTLTIGDGTTTVFTVTHNLNTIDTLVLVREAAGDQSFIYPEIRTVNANSVQVIFDAAPASNQYRVLVTGGTFSTVALSGAAGGDLSGSYPNPDIAAGVVTNAEVAAAAAILKSKIAGGIGIQEIQDVQLGSPQGTIDFTSIPQTFKHLLIVGSWRSTGSGAQSLACRYNNDGTTAYGWAAIYSAGGTAAANNSASAIQMRIANGIGSVTDQQFCGFVHFVPSYAQSIRHTSISLGAGYMAFDYAGIWGGRHYQTPAAITRLVYFVEGGSEQLSQGTQITLYGVG